VFASSCASALELVREGVADIHQQQAFAPIYMRKHQLAVAVVAEQDGGAAAAGEPKA
jgi:segregation and condensation protein A